MLNKRKPKIDKLCFPTTQNPRKSVKKLKLGKTVEETIQSLSGMKLDKYHKIMDWKSEKGIKDEYLHLKPKRKEDQEE